MGSQTTATEKIEIKKSKHSKKRHALFPKPLVIAKVIAPIKYEQPLLKIVNESGLIELIDVDSRGDLEAYHVPERRQKLDGLASQLQSQINYLAQYGLTPPNVKKDERVKIKDENDAIQYAEKLLKEVGTEVEFIEGEIKSIDNKLTQLKAMIELIKALDKLGVSYEAVTPGPKTSVYLGTVFYQRFERLRWELEEKTDGTIFILSVPQTKEDVLMLVVTLKKYDESVRESLRQSNFNRIEIPKDVDKLVFQKEGIFHEQYALTTKKAELEQKLKQIAQENAVQYYAAKEAIEIHLRRLQLLNHMRRTKHTFTFWGWIEEKNKETFKAKVINATQGASTITFTDPDFDESLIPTPIEHPKFLKPIQGLVLGYGTPSRKEIDPFWFVFVLYPIFFGIMFADVGHGFVLALVGFYLWLKKRKMAEIPDTLSGMIINGAELLIISGISAMFWGFMFGSFFGDEVFLRTTFIADLPLVKQMNHFLTYEEHGEIKRNYTSLLLLSFLVGFITLSIGLAINLYQKLVASHHKEEILTALFMFTFYFGAGVGIGLLFVIPILGKIILAISLLSVVAIFVLEYMHSKFEGAILAFDHTITLVSHTVSFSRILAMNTVHFAFSFLAFYFTQMLGSERYHTEILFHSPEHWYFSVWWVIGALIGTLIVVPVEGVFSTLQSLRLTWVEFFGKFFVGDGKLFKPHTFTRKYTTEEV